MASMRRTYAIALLTALWLSLLAGCGETNKQFIELVNQGAAAVERQDFDRAEALFNDALKMRPNDPEVLFHLGTFALRSGRFDEAAKHLQASLVGDPNHPDALITLAKAYFEAQKPVQAKQALDRLFILDAGHPAGHVLAARIAQGAGGEKKDRKTIDLELRKAIAGDPGYVPAWQLLAQLYDEVGAYDTTRQVLQEGLKFAPKSVELREALGVTMLDLGRPDKAKVELEVAVGLPRARPQIFFNLASAHLRLGEKDAAIQALRSFIAQSQGVLPQDDPLLLQAARMVLKLRGA